MFSPHLLSCNAKKKVMMKRMKTPNEQQAMIVATIGEDFIDSANSPASAIGSVALVNESILGPNK